MLIEYRFNKAMKAEEVLLKKVLSQFLGREVTTEDCKTGFHRVIQQGKHWTYHLMYNEQILGRVERFLHLGRYTVTFTPQHEKLTEQSEQRIL